MGGLISLDKKDLEGFGSKIEALREKLLNHGPFAAIGIRVIPEMSGTADFQQAHAMATSLIVEKIWQVTEGLDAFYQMIAWCWAHFDEKDQSGVNLIANDNKMQAALDSVTLVRPFNPQEIRRIPESPFEGQPIEGIHESVDFLEFWRWIEGLHPNAARWQVVAPRWTAVGNLLDETREGFQGQLDALAESGGFTGKTAEAVTALMRKAAASITPMVEVAQSNAQLVDEMSVKIADAYTAMAALKTNFDGTVTSAKRGLINTLLRSLWYKSIWVEEAADAADSSESDAHAAALAIMRPLNEFHAQTARAIVTSAQKLAWDGPMANLEADLPILMPRPDH